MSVKSLSSNGDPIEVSDHAALLERVVLHQVEDLKDNGDEPSKMELNGPRRKSMVGERFTERIDNKVIMALLLWYFWSGCTLFLNKYLIDLTDGDATLLSCVQMTCTIALGYFAKTWSMGMYPIEQSPNRLTIFSKDVIFIGCLRFSTAFLGLYALKYVEVSFTETVKSTAPAFTLVLSSLLLGEKTTRMMKLSTLPVMAGLALCSATESSFNLDGFIFALATNISECLQNVLSKKMLSLHKVKFNPGEIQYATGLASVLAQVPTFFLFATVQAWNDMTTLPRAFLYILNGIFFHFQTLSAYALMDAISPVTHSVANTLKRALLIWISVIVFKNHVTLYSGLGSAIVFIGVLLYNKARHQ